MDRLQTLSVFVAVAEEEGFAAAGRRLNLSPPTVTRAISQLEARLGVRLLHRTTRLVSLTETGQRYLADCRRILSDLDEADGHAAGVHSAPRGLVHVTASVLFGRKIVAPALIELLDHYPEIAISTLFVDRVVHMVNEGLDVAVRIAELPDSSLTAIRVGSVRRVVCAAPDYLARSGVPHHPDDLVHHELVKFASFAPEAGWPFMLDGKIHNVPVASRLFTNTGDVAIDAALAGRGLTRVLSYQVADHVAAGRLVLVLEPFRMPEVPVHVVHRETNQPAARVRAVVDHLVDTLRTTPALRGR